MKVVKVEVTFESSVPAILEDAVGILKRAVRNIINCEEASGFKFKGKIFVSKIKGKEVK